MTVYPGQDSFVRGEISPRLHARAGIELYRSALAICENFITLAHGGIRKRSGTYFAGETKSSGFERPWPFIFSETQAYMLFFGELYFRVYAYGGPIESSPGVVVEVVTPWDAASVPDLQFEQSGDVLYVTHPGFLPRKITRASSTSWTVTDVFPTNGPFESGNVNQAITMYSSGSSGSVTLTAVGGAPFTADKVGALVKIQVETYETWRPWEAGGLLDTDDPNGELRRYNGNIYSAIDAGAPYGAGVKIYMGGTPPTHLEGTEYDGGADAAETGTGNHYGVKWQYLHSGYGIGQITAVGGGGTTATVTTYTNWPAEVQGSGNASYRWSLGFFQTGAYPKSSAVHEERLFFAHEFSVNGSKTFDFSSYLAGANADDAVSYRLAGTQEITWLHSADGFLLIGTIGGVVTLSGGGQDEQLTPSSFKIRKSPTKRCASIQPVQAGSTFLYVGFDRKTIYELTFSLERNGYRSLPLALISEHIPKAGVASVSYSADPDSLFWLGLDTGEAGAITYEEDQNVRGLHRHRLGGSFGALDYGVIEGHATSPGQNGVDDTWFVVKRTIGGVTKRYIEVLQGPFEYADVEDAFFVDCGLTYEGVAVGTVTGLSHLNGQTVNALANGVIYRGLTVSGGSVTLPGGATATKIHVGLPYTAVADTLELDVGGRDGSIMGRRKKIDTVILSVLESAGIYVRSASRAEGGAFTLNRAGRITIVPESSTVSLYTGNLDPVILDDTWEGRGRLRIECPDPVPATIRAIIPGFNSEGG
jgi:hypothetical protein